MSLAKLYPDWVAELEEGAPDNSWIYAFKNDGATRIRAYNQSKNSHLQGNLCPICCTIDFEYLLFGQPDTGFRDAKISTVYLGSLLEVKARAESGSPFCSHILVYDAHEIVRKGNGIFKDGAGDFLPMEELDVLLRADDAANSRDWLRDTSYGTVYACLRPLSARKKPPTAPGKLEDESNDPDYEDYKTREGNLLRRLNHEDSYELSLKEYADLPKCKAWFENCSHEHADCNEQPNLDSTTQRRTSKDFKLIDIAAREIVVFGEDTGLLHATLSYVCGRSDTFWKLPKASSQWFTDVEGKLRHPLPA